VAFHPYLFFSGNCAEALTRYQEIFGGELDMMRMSEMPADEPAAPPEQADLVMHAALTFGDNLLMASDDPTGDGGSMKGVAINFSTDDGGEADRVFAALADAGEVTMPMEQTFWSPKFGMCVDRFGVPWMVNVEPTEAP
jgi:PhnB protein